MIMQVGQWTIDPDEVAAYRYSQGQGYGLQTVFVILRCGLQLDGSMDMNQINGLLQHMNARKTEIKVTKE